ncbi:MAG: hypothetical protein ACJ8H8_24915 [Geminicoccaceae bacterium]
MTYRAPVLALVLPLVLAHPLLARAADTAPATCSLATLSGTYLFAFSGTSVAAGGATPFAVAGYEVYDGAGGMRSVTTTNANGKLKRNVRQPGAYTVAADCTGTVTYADGTIYDLFLAPDGANFVFVETNPERVAAGFEPRATAQRVAK